MTSRFQTLSTAVMAMCAITVTALVVRREFFTPGPGDDRIQRVENPARFAERGSRLGPAEARLTIVEFSDFQCPACRQLAGSLKRVRERHPEVAVLYRHFPLPSHEDAAEAAVASECAGEQGRFEAFHDGLFAGQDSIGKRPWRAYAAAAGVADLEAFERCTRDARPRAALNTDIAAGEALGTVATPTLLINDLRVRGAPSPEMLEELVAEALAASR